jgi:hypothetical protein
MLYDGREFSVTCQEELPEDLIYVNSGDPGQEYRDATSSWKEDDLVVGYISHSPCYNGFCAHTVANRNDGFQKQNLKTIYYYEDWDTWRNTPTQENSHAWVTYPISVSSGTWNFWRCI